MSDVFHGLRETKKNSDCDNDSSSTDTDSFIDSFVGMVGGNNKIPNGGYPPIKVCIEHKKEEKEVTSHKKDKKLREFSNNINKNLSVHQILDDRRKKPFFEV